MAGGGGRGYGMRTGRKRERRRGKRSKGCVSLLPAASFRASACSSIKWEDSSHKFSPVKSRMMFYPCFASQDITVTTSHLCHCTGRAARDNLPMSVCGPVPINLYLQRQMVGQIALVVYVKGKLFIQWNLA